MNCSVFPSFSWIDAIRCLCAHFNLSTLVSLCDATLSPKPAEVLFSGYTLFAWNWHTTQELFTQYLLEILMACKWRDWNGPSNLNKKPSYLGKLGQNGQKWVREGFLDFCLKLRAKSPNPAICIFLGTLAGSAGCLPNSPPPFFAALPSEVISNPPRNAAI